MTTLVTNKKRIFDTAANFASNNPTPLSGEICVETNTGKCKIGDGSTAYASLPYTAPEGTLYNIDVPQEVATGAAIGSLAIATLTGQVAAAQAAMSDQQGATAIGSVNTALNSIGVFVNRLEAAIAKSSASL